MGEHNEEVRREVEDLRAGENVAVGAPLRNAGAAMAQKGALHGIKVVDLGFALAGPFATQVMADLGASVIKVNIGAIRGGTPVTSHTGRTAASGASGSISRRRKDSPCCTG